MNTVKNIICVEGKKAQGVNNRLLPPVTSCCFFASFSVQQFIMYSVVKKNSKENLVIGSFKKKPRRKTQCEPFAILDRTLTCEKTVVL